MSWKLHNAMWPGLVGKGEDEPPIDLNTMLDLTEKAEVDGVKFDGVDLFLADPHTSIDADDARACFADDDISLEADAAGVRHDEDLFVGPQTHGIDQILINGDAADVVEVGLGYSGVVDFGAKDSAHR